MTTSTLLIGSFFLCGTPLIALALGFFIGRRVDRLRSPFVLRTPKAGQQRIERGTRSQSDELPYGSK